MMVSLSVREIEMVAARGRTLPCRRAPGLRAEACEPVEADFFIREGLREVNFLSLSSQLLLLLLSVGDVPHFKAGEGGLETGELQGRSLMEGEGGGAKWV